jgi:hypothetical protein
MLTEKTKTCLAIALSVLFAIAITCYTAFVSKRLPIQKLPVPAKVAFVICFTTGTAFNALWGFFAFLAKSKRRPGVSWWQANAAFDIGASRFYTDEGVRTLRKGRNCFIAWVLFWGNGIAIVAAAGGYR